MGCARKASAVSCVIMSTLPMCSFLRHVPSAPALGTSHLRIHMIDTHCLTIACGHVAAIGGKLGALLDQVLRRRKLVVEGDDKVFRKNDDTTEYMRLLGSIAARNYDCNKQLEVCFLKLITLATFSLSLACQHSTMHLTHIRTGCLLCTIERRAPRATHG